jgi:NADH dehydrogenase [ubiquinone] 1 alpha subcomplex assembly factor 6
MALLRSAAKEAILAPTCGRSFLFSTGSASGKAHSASDYCVDLVKSADFDNYLCGLLIPKSARRAFFAIRAFNVEIAQIRDHSNNNFLTGRIRFQYYRDSIDKIYSSVDNDNSSDIVLQPVLQELKQSIKQHNLTRRYFERCIEARIEDFATTNSGTGCYQSLSEIENYAESSQSSLLYLLLEALGAVPTGEGQETVESLKDNMAARAASHVGCSFGLMTLLRAFPYHLSQVFSSDYSSQT